MTSPMQVGAQQMPGVLMELTATGKGAKPTVTKKPKPFDPQKMMGGASPAQSGKKKPRN